MTRDELKELKALCSQLENLAVDEDAAEWVASDPAPRGDLTFTVRVPVVVRVTVPGSAVVVAEAAVLEHALQQAARRLGSALRRMTHLTTRLVGAHAAAAEALRALTPPD